MTTSPLFTGECRTTFFNSSIQAKFNPFGMASLVFTGHLLSSAPSIQTVEVMTRRSEEHTSELQSRQYLVCRLLLEKKKKNTHPPKSSVPNKQNWLNHYSCSPESST